MNTNLNPGPAFTEGIGNSAAQTSHPACWRTYPCPTPPPFAVLSGA